MAIMKIGRALFFAYSIVSCALLARANVVRADVVGDQIIGDVAHRTARSSKSKDDLAKGGGFLHVYGPSEQYGTEKPVPRKKRKRF
jgi:hypothetical protein